MTLGPLVDAAWLRAHLEDPDLRLIDFRWYLVERDGREEYLRAHIPGAVFVDLEAVTGSAGGGRHPLPAAGQFEAEMRRAGVSDGTKVIVYDDAGGSIAARLWFLLGWFGHGAQAVLDGGLQAWGEPVDRSVPEVSPGTFRSRVPDASRILDFEAVRSLHGVPLIDGRAAERYTGEKEPVDPKAGHIPGALSRPWKANLRPDGRFLPAADLRRQLTAMGAESGAVLYCGSGVNACHNLLAMELAGLPDGRLYAGSWSDWASHDAPVATGSAP